jgi:hypothetical protein
LLAKLPPTVFQADDSLGWSYQFWQAPKKEEVQRQMKQAGTKVGADELPAVTQLFTEQYMVAFLLENALGGWWQSRHPRMKLPVEMPYLRFVGEGAVPPAPTFGTARRRNLPGLARHARPVQAARPLRRFRPLPRLGLPLPGADAPRHRKALGARCHRPRARRQPARPRTRCPLRRDRRLRAGPGRLALPGRERQAIGYRPLPRLNIACVGVAPRSKKADWLKLAGGDERLEGGMAALYALFQKAPELGSLIDPMAATRGDLLDAHWVELESRLEQALAQKGDEQEIEARVAAQGMVHASRILTRKYHLVITNPPYLGADSTARCSRISARNTTRLPRAILPTCFWIVASSSARPAARCPL